MLAPHLVLHTAPLVCKALVLLTSMYFELKDNYYLYLSNTQLRLAFNKKKTLGTKGIGYIYAS